MLLFLVGVGGDIPWIPEMKVYSLCQIGIQFINLLHKHFILFRFHLSLFTVFLTSI